jgi:hypothetical protein
MAEKKPKLTKDEQEQVLEHANEVLTDQKTERSLKQPVKGLEMIAELALSVDTNLMTMPEARKSLANWFNEQPDRKATVELLRPRMRRFKQIADALYEEVATLIGSQRE